MIKKNKRSKRSWTSESARVRWNTLFVELNTLISIISEYQRKTWNTRRSYETLSRSQRSGGEEHDRCIRDNTSKGNDSKIARRHRNKKRCSKVKENRKNTAHKQRRVYLLYLTRRSDASKMSTQGQVTSSLALPRPYPFNLSRHYSHSRSPRRPHQPSE